MGFNELCEKFWQEMSINKKKKLILWFQNTFSMYSKQWNGLDDSSIIEIHSFDNLPSDFRGCLIMAVTDKGFSIEELVKVQKLMLQVTK